jgi:membrane-bound inhibitor of C-type lysozyme
VYDSRDEVVERLKSFSILESSVELDTDNDGIPDNIEVALGLNPNSNDSDGDGYLDGEEIGGDVNSPRNTDGDDEIDALDLDSDNDGISDAEEREAGTNALVKTNPMVLNLENSINMVNFSEYNLSIPIEHLQKENIEIFVEIEDTSLVTLKRSWNYEPVSSEQYSEANPSLIINALNSGESNISIRLRDEQDREISKNILLTITEQLASQAMLKRNGWNLMAICQDINTSTINVSDILEIQSQDGKTLYVGENAEHSNLKILEAGYGYWVKGKVGTLFDVGIAEDGLSKPLRRTGWSLMASCQERSRDSLDMTDIKEIQSQSGQTVYTGENAEYSNLSRFLNGYGYWVKGEKGTLFNAKEGLKLPKGFEYQTISNNNKVVESHYEDLTVRLYANYPERVNSQALHMSIIVYLDESNYVIMPIQATYQGHELVVGIYDKNNKLISISPITMMDDDFIIIYMNIKE